MDDRLVAFLYLLMRDHVPVGTVERAVKLIREEAHPPSILENANEHLRAYARDVAGKLVG
jgi:hypothetical protein